MRAELSYRTFVVTRRGKEILRAPLTGPINDLIGAWDLDEPEDSAYLIALLSRGYGAFTRPPESGLHDVTNDPDVRAAFERAIELAPKGQVGAAIGAYLERLRFHTDGTADVDDFASLAAWSLLESVRRLKLKLRRCPTCKRPWLGPPSSSRYCQRKAPGQTRDCRILANEKRLAGDTAYRAYRREYKMLHERLRRGALTADDFVVWSRENSPSDWTKFDDWRAERRREEADG